MVIDKYEKLIGWLQAINKLSFGEQNSLAGNGQCLPLCGAITTLALFGATLASKHGSPDLVVCFV